MLRIKPPDIFFLKNARPGWSLTGSALDFYFSNNLYYGGNLANSISLSRASAGIAADTAGALYSFAANIPRITDQGFLIEEARTNKSTNYNANPTDLTNVTKGGDAASVLSVVDDTAALLAAGLQNIASSGKVYKLDNSAGVATATVTWAGGTGNTNVHTSSAYLRGSGTGGVALAATTQDQALTSSYVRRVLSATPASAASVGYIRATAGSIVYFILNQLEEGAFVTSPIVIAGASAARAADVPQLIGPALAAALAAKSAFFQTSGLGGNAGARLFDMSGGFLSTLATTTTVYVQGTGSTTATLGSGTSAGVVKIGLGFDLTSLTAVANSGTKTSGGILSGQSGSVYLGNRSSGAAALNGYMQRFALSPVKGVFDSLTA